MIDNRLDEIRHWRSSYIDPLVSLQRAFGYIDHLLQLLDTGPAVAGDAQLLAKEVTDAMYERRFPIINGMQIVSTSSDPKKVLTDHIAAAITTHANQRYREGVEAAMKAVCSYCRDGIELAENNTQHIWPGPWPRQWDYCEAVAIRALLQESE